MFVCVDDPGLKERLANQSAEHKRAKDAAKRRIDEVTARAAASAAKVNALSIEVKVGSGTD